MFDHDCTRAGGKSVPRLIVLRKLTIFGVVLWCGRKTGTCYGCLISKAEGIKNVSIKGDPVTTLVQPGPTVTTFFTGTPDVGRNNGTRRCRTGTQGYPWTFRV